MIKYPKANKVLLQHFKGCHDRVRDGKVSSIQWPRNNAGFKAFCKEIGPRPRAKQKWSVGRIKHSLGYIEGNIRWELYKYNSVKRKGTKFEHETCHIVQLRVLKFKKGTKEYFAHQKAAVTKRWNDPKQHKAMSKRMLGNKHARRAK
jgi:hypothetical protein